MGGFEALNNREISILIWISIFLCYGFLNSGVRSSLIDVVKAFFDKKLTIVYVMMFGYIGGMLCALSSIGYWGLSNYTAIGMWVICVAFLTLFEFKKANNENFLVEVFKDNLKLIIVLEFIINLYVSSLIVELTMVPVLFIITAVMAYSENRKEYEPAHKLSTRMLGIIGTVICVSAIWRLFNDFENFATVKSLGDFLTPIILSLMFIPFVYCFALFANYETLFVRIQFFVKNRDEEISKRAKLKTVLAFGLNLRALNDWAKELSKHWFESAEQYSKALSEFKANRKERYNNGG